MTSSINNNILVDYLLDTSIEKGIRQTGPVRHELSTVPRGCSAMPKRPNVSNSTGISINSIFAVMFCQRKKAIFSASNFNVQSCHSD